MANYPVKLLKDKDGTAFVPVVNSDSIITPEGDTLNDLLEEKQDLLTSGTNIKTINNESLLGSGNISIQGGSGASVWGSITGTLSNQTDLNTALNSKANANSIPTKTSDLINDSGFITSSVSKYSLTELKALTDPTDDLFLSLKADIINHNPMVITYSQNLNSSTSISAEAVVLSATVETTQDFGEVYAISFRKDIISHPGIIHTLGFIFQGEQFEVVEILMIENEVVAEAPEPTSNLTLNSLEPGDMVGCVPNMEIRYSESDEWTTLEGVNARDIFIKNVPPRGTGDPVGYIAAKTRDHWYMVYAAVYHKSGDELGYYISELTYYGRNPINPIAYLLKNSVQKDRLVEGANISIEDDESGLLTISHANSGVTAGTYKSVTVDSKGHVTAGTNPTTLSGYGITDAKISNGTITLGSNTITPSTIKNIKDGSASGSVRTSASMSENNSYTMGKYAFAEGYRTKASGPYAHAEGYYTEASGDSSHAEGYYTTAQGPYSHAEGCSTQASGDISHSEGYNTAAKGSYSHSEGRYTVASKESSHAEGYWARAVGKNSHAEGGWDSSTPYNIIGTVVSVDTENKTYEVSGLTRYINSDNNYVGAMCYYTSNGSDESYYITSETYDTTTNNFTFGVPYILSSITVGSSFYIKISSVALGNFSHSEGKNTFAIGSSSHAEGWETTARYNGSHAEGCNTYAGPFAHAEGYYTEANGDHSHSEGDHTQASNSYAHAEGYYTEASGDSSHAEGSYTKGTGNYSHAEGFRTQASNYYTHAEGYNTIASGRDASHAEGYATVAAGASSHAEGGLSGYFQQGTVVSVDAENRTYEVSGLPVLYNATGYPIYNGASYSKVNSGYFNSSYIILSSDRSNDNYIFTVSGFYTTIAAGDPFYITMGPKAQGSCSHAEGQTCLAIGSGSHAEGNRTIASGSYSHAEGDNTVASNSSSHAEGYRTTASGKYSHAGGYHTQANKDYQTAIGKYNKNVNNALLEIGNGTADDSRSNAFVVYSDGKAELGADPTSSMHVATKQYVDNNILKNIEDGSAMGSVRTSQSESEGDSYTMGVCAFSEGSYTKASGDYSHAEGYLTTASGTSGAHSEGSSTIASGDYSHAEGYQTRAVASTSHAEGFQTIASGNRSHAEGWSTIASGNYSHAEGGRKDGYLFSGTVVSVDAENQTYEVSGVPKVDDTLSDSTIYSGAFYSGSNYIDPEYRIVSAVRSSETDNVTFTVSSFSPYIEVGNSFRLFEGSKASGSYSHAEGYGTYAIGFASHAEGYNTIASGSSSHAGGYYTKAKSSYQTIVGKYNDNKNNTLFEVGNGTADDARSNAFEVYSDGRAVVGADPTTAMGVATKQYVDGTLNTYSTGEQRIGTWINGKPIYRKVFSFTTPEGNVDYIINTGISMDTIIKVYGGIASAGGITPIPAAFDWGGTIYTTSFRVSDNNIYYRGHSAYGSKPAFAIIEYTKTTD